MAVLLVGAVGDNLRCFQSVFMFVSSANACFRVGDLFDVFAHSYASHTWPNDLFSPAHGSNSETSAIHSTSAIQSTAADKLTLVHSTVHRSSTSCHYGLCCMWKVDHRPISSME